MKAGPSPHLLVHCLFFSIFPSLRPSLKASIWAGNFFFKSPGKDSDISGWTFLQISARSVQSNEISSALYLEIQTGKEKCLILFHKSSSRNPTTGPISHSLPNHLRVCLTDHPAEEDRGCPPFGMTSPAKVVWPLSIGLSTDCLKSHEQFKVQVLL